MLRSGVEKVAKSFKQIFSKKKKENKEPSIPPEVADASPEIANASPEVADDPPEVADDSSPEDDVYEEIELNQLKEELKQTKRRLRQAEKKIASLEEKLELSNQQTAKKLQMLDKEFQLMKKTAADERDAQLCTRMDQLEKVKNHIPKDKKDYQFFDAEKERAAKLRRPPSKNRNEPKRKDDQFKRSETPDEKNNSKEHQFFDPEKERAPKPRRPSSNDRSAPKRTDDSPVIRNDSDVWIQVGDTKKCDNASHDPDCLCQVTPDQFKRLETPVEKNNKKEHQSSEPEKERTVKPGRPSSSNRSPQKRTDDLRRSRNGNAEVRTKVGDGGVQTCDNDSHHLDCLCRLTPEQFKRFGILPDGNKKSNSK